MKPVISIPEPCDVQWNSMEKAEQGKHCQVCATQVIDFSTMPLDAIVSHLQTHSSQKICGRYHVRHTEQAGWWLRTVNALEAVLLKKRLKRVAMFSIAVLLFFSNCTRRRVVGKYALMQPATKGHSELLARK